MSILIKGMEMPKRCGECPCFHAETPMYCQAVKADKNKKIIAPYGKPRPDWCPLVPVSPHGRLGDLDKLENGLRHMAKYQHVERQQGILGCCETIRLSPTIIPAEEGE